MQSPVSIAPRLLASCALLALFLLSLLATTPLVHHASAQTSSNTCLNLPIVPGVSASSATSLALSSPDFTAAVAGDTYRFGGAANAFHCGKLIAIDANFIVTNSTGGEQDVIAILGVSDSNTPRNVTGISVLPVFSFSSFTTGTWTGYQFCNANGQGSSCPTTPSVVAKGAYGTFTQPNVYVPSGTGAPSCYGSTACTFGLWVGLDTAGAGQGSEYVLQTGSLGVIYQSGGSHHTNYYLWWEDVESGSSTATVCSGLFNGNFISPGDNLDMNVTVYSGDTYTIYSYDGTNQNECTPNYGSPYTFNHTPYFEDFIGERQGWNGVFPTHLANFDTTSFYGQVEWGTTWYPISRPYGDGWYDQALMKNNGVTNACSGTWSSGTCYAYVSGGITAGTFGAFSTTWISSQYT